LPPEIIFELKPGGAHVFFIGISAPKYKVIDTPYKQFEVSVMLDKINFSRTLWSEELSKK
jgi:copper(I)-binding protein